MCLHYFFFLLFFPVSISDLQSQEIGRDFVTAVNNPFAETVRPVFEYSSDQLVLKLVNGFHKAVLLTEVELTQPGSKSGNLLKTPVDICPAETKYFTLDPRSVDLSQKIRVVLQLSPKPPKQKSEFVFRFESGTNRIVEAESEQPR